MPQPARRPRHWPALALILASAVPASGDDALATELVEWLRTNGAKIHDGLAIRHVDPSDPTSPRGVFATRTIDEGEVLCNIPWDLMITPGDKYTSVDDSDEGCRAIVSTIEAFDDGTNAYARYLLGQPRRYLPDFWSDSARALLSEMLAVGELAAGPMTERDELPPHGIGEDGLLDWLVEDCEGFGIDWTNETHVHAAMIVTARADYQYLVPFYDMFNHNGKGYNIAHRYNPYSGDRIDQTGYEVYTTKSIEAGEELLNSYNRCNICNSMYDWFGAPEMFANFGIVNGMVNGDMPQMFLFDFARVKFELDHGADGGVEVRFLVPPSEKGIGLLEWQLRRLADFAKERRDRGRDDQGDISEYEWDMIWRYHAMLQGAISLAVNGSAKEERTDEVWSMDDDWWVKDGNTNMAAGYAWIYPNLHQNLASEEL